MNLKKIREQWQLSQKEVAKKLNLNANTLCNYENQTTEPKIETLIQLANFYNVSLDYLCDRPFNNNIGYIPEDRKEIIKQICELDDTSFNELKTFLYGYIKGKENSTNFNIYKK